MRRSSVLMIAFLTSFFPVASIADGDAFLKAVTFALMGSDASPPTVVNREDCIFQVVTGKNVETYHLNNVDPSRTRFTRMMLRNPDGPPTNITNVDIYGEDTVYESGSAGGWSSTQLKSKTLVVRTEESDRLIRAWKFIYENGCKGKASSF